MKNKKTSQQQTFNLKPDDLLNHQFSVMNLGYNAEEVDRLLDEVIQDYHQADELIAKYQQEIKELKQKLLIIQNENEHLLLEMGVSPKALKNRRAPKSSRKDQLDEQHDREQELFQQKQKAKTPSST